MQEYEPCKEHLHNAEATTGGLHVSGFAGASVGQVCHFNLLQTAVTGYRFAQLKSETEAMLIAKLSTYLASMSTYLPYRATIS